MILRRRLLLVAMFVAIACFFGIAFVTLTAVDVDPITVADLTNASALRVLTDGSNASLPNSTFLFFVHMPKTAGQAFAAGLRVCSPAMRRSPPSPTHTTKDPHWPTVRTPRPLRVRAPRHSGAPILTSRLDLNFAQVASLGKKFRDPEYVRRMYAGKRIGVGHCDVTVTNVLDPARPTIFVTVLRDPVARVKSLYYYLTTRMYSRVFTLQALVTYIDGLNGYEDLVSESAANNDTVIESDYREQEAEKHANRRIPEKNRNGTLNEWWANVALESFNMSEAVSLQVFAKLLQLSSQDNYQTRALSGNLALTFRNDSVPRAVDAQMLSDAKATLRAMPFFGLTEYFAASVVLFEESIGTVLNCSALPTVRRNTTPNFRSRSLLTSDHQIAEMERFDLQLYAFAKRLFLYRCKHSIRCEERLREMTATTTTTATNTTMAASQTD